MNRVEMEMESILYAPAFVQQRRENVCLLIDPNAPNWASVSPAGSALLRRCDGRHTLQEIAAGAEHDLGLAPEQTERFFREASGAGLVSLSPDLSPAYRGRSEAIGCGRLEELWIHTNNSCPLRCKHCLVDGGSEVEQPLTASEIKNVVDQAAALGAGRVYFTGGDPFMRRDILSLIEYVTSRVQLVVLTSGVLLAPERVARSRKVPRGKLLVQISLEGPDAETNDAIRGAGNFDRAVRGIRRLVAAGLEPIVTTTITRLNQHRLPDTTRFLASIGVKDHHILWLHARGRMRQSADELLLPGDRVAEIMAELRRTAREAGIVVDNSESLLARVRGKRGRKNDLCNCCYSELAVGPDGHVFPCAALVGARDFDCGSLRERTLKEIWLESPVAEWVRRNSVQKRVGCSSCYLKFFCGGGCFAQSYFDYELAYGRGCIMAPDPYCEAYRRELADLMWELALPPAQERDGGHPAVYRTMDNHLQSCAADGNEVLDAAFEVGTYHCACVLAMDVKEN